jgi:hypothetical protein
MSRVSQRRKSEEEAATHTTTTLDRHFAAVVSGCDV